MRKLLIAGAMLVVTFVIIGSNWPAVLPTVYSGDSLRNKPPPTAGCRPSGGRPKKCLTPTAEPYPPPATATAEPYPPPATLTATAEPYPPPGTATATAEPYPPPGTATATAEPYPPPRTRTPHR